MFPSCPDCSVCFGLRLWASQIMILKSSEPEANNLNIKYNYEIEIHLVMCSSFQKNLTKAFGADKLVQYQKSGKFSQSKNMNMPGWRHQ